MQSIVSCPPRRQIKVYDIEDRSVSQVEPGSSLVRWPRAVGAAWFPTKQARNDTRKIKETNRCYDRLVRQTWSSEMTALVQALSRLSIGSNPEIEALRMIVALCGIGLFVSLLCASYGLDLGLDFF
jgi:hypothetical protein